MRITKKNKKTTIFTVVIVALLLAATAGAYWYYDTETPQQNPPDTSDTPTREAKTEDQVITIPESTEDEKIKDYELITSNHEYKIRRLDDRYTITLYAIINRPDQYEMYRQQLAEYEQKALDYLTSQNINVNEIEITYEPEEAQDL